MTHSAPDPTHEPTREPSTQPTIGFTSGGRPVTEETIARLADEAEAGYDPARLRRVPGRPPMGSAAARVVPVRLDPELEEALRRRAEVEHSTPSTVIREALRAWLTPA